MMRSGICPRMNVVMLLIGPDGKIKEVRKGQNMVVTTGLYHVADQLSSSPGQTAMSQIMVGTGTTATSAATTSLEASAAADTLDSRTDSAGVVTYVVTFGPGEGTGALTEAGIFNVSNVMLCRLVFAVINKGSLDTLVISWTLTVYDDGVGD